MKNAPMTTAEMEARTSWTRTEICTAGADDQRQHQGRGEDRADEPDRLRDHVRQPQAGLPERRR
jgi:hypothetical protein